MKDKWVPSIHMGEVVLFSACMGALMHYHNNEPETMAPLVRTLISRIVFGAPLPSSHRDPPMVLALPPTAKASPSELQPAGESRSARQSDSSASSQWEEAGHAQSPPAAQVVGVSSEGYGEDHDQSGASAGPSSRNWTML
eukprot:scaffold138389_cov48-Prasinocladus_malaysianus.AAC.2